MTETTAGGKDFDPERTYTDDEKQHITSNLRGITAEVFRGQLRDASCVPALVQAWHARLFAEVRGHAGRVRSADFGQEKLRFGPNWSATRGEVPALLEALFSEVRTSLASFDADPEAPKYEASAVHLAVWAHARFISIHPFEDGNGRIGRLWMSWTLDRLHLVPLSIEAPKQEYLEGLNIFYRTGELQPLIDLFLDIYLQNAEPM